MGILDNEPIPRKTMVLFFIVDTSGSMTGTKIASLNDAIRNVLPELDDISKQNADALIKIAVLEFSSGARWLHNTPVEGKDFKWNNLEASGLTDMGLAFNSLNEKLSRHAFMNEVGSSFAPVLFLMSDGAPTDDWERELNSLRANKWYTNAIKLALAIGDDANHDILKEFTGNIESVLTAKNPEVLKKMIRAASVTASQIGSQSTGIGQKSKQDDFNDQMKDVVADITDIDTNGTDFEGF